MIMDQGYAKLKAANLGFPPEASVMNDFSSSLKADPRGPGKLHSRDVIYLDRSPIRGTLLPCESETVRHTDGTDDYSRFKLLSTQAGLQAVEAVINLCRTWLRDKQVISADYFRYGPGVEVGLHQDKFGDLGIIWVLNRECTGASSILVSLSGTGMISEPLKTGDLLVFRDDMFTHGMTMLTEGQRDALIFITHRER
jgi:hypothetical protein